MALKTSPKLFGLALFVVLISTGPSTGQDRVHDLKLDLQQRYRLDLVHLQGASGDALAGLFTLAGELTPEISILEKAGEIDPREVAHSFFDQEADLFALNPDQDDLRLSRIFSDKNEAIHLVYHRWLGELPLDGMEIRVHVDAAGKIYSVDGNSVPLTFAEQEAIASRLAESHLDKEDVATLLLQDLQAQGIPKEILTFKMVERLALPTFPYVIWRADVVAAPGNGRWFYRIDALTGEILERVNALKSTDEKEPLRESRFADLPPSRLLPTVEDDKQALPSSGNPVLRTKEEPPPVAATEGFKRELPDPVTGLLNPTTIRLDYASSEEAKAKRAIEQ